MVRLIFIILVVVAAFFLFRKRYLFKIEIRGYDPSLKGSIPGRSWSEISDFIRTLNLPSGSTITAYPDGKRFRLVFGGTVSESERQRIRNFLYLR